jgi:uncharacterized membrane protein YjfL (UPF0719 family)
MDFIEDLAYDVLSGLLYGGVGIALMMAGFYVIDLLTPGRLGQLICDDRRRDVGIVVAAGMIANAAIVTSAIFASEGDLGEGLAESAAFGLAGLLLLALAFAAVDRVTPGRLGDILADEHEDPAVAYVTAASLIGVGAIIAAAIS